MFAQHRHSTRRAARPSVLSSRRHEHHARRSRSVAFRSVAFRSSVSPSIVNLKPRTHARRARRSRAGPRSSTSFQKKKKVPSTTSSSEEEEEEGEEDPGSVDRSVRVWKKE